MPRPPRPLARSELEHKDTRIFVLATEDTHAVQQYFDFFRFARLRIKFLGTKDGESAPQHVLQRLRDIREDCEIRDTDQLWLLVDTDHWADPSHMANFKTVIRDAKKMNVGLAVSNPCFELWLLLHHEDVSDPSSVRNCKLVQEKIRAKIGQFNKSLLVETHYGKDHDELVKSASVAATRAENLAPDGDWPSGPGTHVFRLFKAILPFVQPTS